MSFSPSLSVRVPAPSFNSPTVSGNVRLRFDSAKSRLPSALRSGRTTPVTDQAMPRRLLGLRGRMVDQLEPHSVPKASPPKTRFVPLNCLLAKAALVLAIRNLALRLVLPAHDTLGAANAERLAAGRTRFDRRIDCLWRRSANAARRGKCVALNSTIFSGFRGQNRINSGGVSWYSRGDGSTRIGWSWRR